MTTNSMTINAGSGAPSRAAGRSGGPGLVRPSLTLWKREMVRFLRQRNRVIGALATPVLFWLLLGSGLNKTFVVPTSGEAQVNATADNAAAAGEGLGYLAYFFPGMLVMILLFTAIFSTISVIEDRKEGFLQGVLASPAPRLAIVLGKILGGATLATGQAVLVMLLWPTIGELPGIGAVLLSIVAMFVTGMGLTALGLCLAWPMDSTAGFHAIMNLLLMPMWFLCGALFPVATAPVWMQAIMYANPLTYGHHVLATLLHGDAGTPLAVPLLPAAGLMVAFAVVFTAFAAKIAAKPSRTGK